MKKLFLCMKCQQLMLPSCGMKPEFVAHSFEPFTRAENAAANKVQGTGPGMAITKNIVEPMDIQMPVMNGPAASRAIRGHEQVNPRFYIRKALLSGSRSGCLQIGSFCALRMGYRCNPIAFHCKKCENPLETPVCACYDPCEKTTKEANPMDSCDRRNVHTTMDTDRASGVRALPLLK